MEHEKHRYTRIASTHVSGARLLSESESSEAKEKSGGGPANRIFIETGDGFPVGSYVRFDLKVPDKKTFEVTGITEWSNDDTNNKQPIGAGIRLIEIYTDADEESAAGAEDVMDDEAEVDIETGSETAEPADESALPSPDEISDLLGNMLDMKIATKEGTPVEIDPETPGAVATFVLENGAIKALWVCDLDTIIAIGAPLAEIPPDVAAGHVASKEIPEKIRENFHEVMNVSASLFNKPDKPHLSLGTLVMTPDPVPDELTPLLNNPSYRSDILATFPKFGEGKMSIMLSQP